MLYFTSVVVQSGPMKVTNHTTGEEALLKFHAYSYFSRDRQKKVLYIHVKYVHVHACMQNYMYMCILHYPGNRHSEGLIWSGALQG